MTTGRVKTIEQNRWWDPLAAFLLMIAALTVALRLDATSWANELSIIPSIVFLAVAAGLSLGISRFPALITLLLSIAYGTFIITWQFGNTLIGELTWLERISILNGRLSLIISQLTNGEKVTDNLLFSITLTAIFWLLAVGASYILTRHGYAWWAVLPLGAALVIIQSFHPSAGRQALYFPVFLFFSLSLIARMAYQKRSARWNVLHTYLPANLSFDFIRFSIIIITLLILTAWTVPALADAMPLMAEAAAPVRSRWNELKKEWENAFSSLNNRTQVYVVNFGDTLNLGLGSSLKETPIFLVRVPEFSPTAVNYYWRATVYDRYQDGSWSDYSYTLQPFDPNGEALNLPLEQNRWLNTFEVQPISLSNSFFSPGQPLWSSLPAEVKLASNPDNTVDVAGFQAIGSDPIRQTYLIQSSLSIPTIKQMREVDSEYPQSILDRYLALPESITPRTRELALQITQGLENPYDKVVAITDYLRSNYVYQETIDAPATGQEPIDWFLFNYKKGFCNYYASAEVIMLRSLGIPARMAVGYAQGELQEDGRYLARARDAHAWPEVYFPSLGWVEFEPTSSQPNVVRLSGQPFRDTLQERLEEQAELDALRQRQLEELENQRQGEFSQPAIETNNGSPTWWIWLVGLCLTAGLIYLLWRFWKIWGFSRLPLWIESTLLKIGLQPPKKIRTWASYARLPLMSRSYNEINLALTRLGRQPLNHQTPSERADVLGELLPEAGIPAQILVSEYQRTIFSPQAGNPARGEIAGNMIRRLSRRAKLEQQKQNLLKHFRRSSQS